MQISDERRLQIATYLSAGNSIADANRKFGHAKSTLRLIRREVLGIAPQPVEYSRVDDSGSHVPTRAEIQAACRQFQNQWTPAEEQKRRLGIGARQSLPPSDYTFPAYNVSCGKGRFYLTTAS